MDCLHSKLAPLSADCLAQELRTQNYCLIDIRPSSQHCSNHIKGSENINFTNILLRRLIKGIVSLESHISSEELVSALYERNPETTKLVLYDSCSKEGLVKSEVPRHAEVLYKTKQPSSALVYYLDGGISVFSKLYPDLCEASPISSTRVSIGISVSNSLPINFDRPSYKMKKVRAQTTLEDESGQFGPPVEILPHLVLGCSRASSNLGLLRKFGVTAVLNVSHNCASHFEELFKYKVIPVQDSHHADLLSQLEAAFEFINSIKAAQGKVFVHCHAGISRSATVCIAYIMKHLEMCLSKSYDFVKHKRPCISPNLHFMGQLLEFERQLQEASPNRDSPLFFEEPLPASVESIPVSISATNSPRTTDSFKLHLPLNKLPKNHLKRSYQSASAPSSIGTLEQADPSQAKIFKAAMRMPPYYSLMGRFYSSTDGCVYPTMKAKHVQTNSLPATPVESLREPLLTSSCRVQLNNSQSPLSPCRVVACTSAQFI